jgi:hypothetical protein
MLFDYLHDFRVWANYLDIDNLLQLWGAGYKSILDANLSLLLFFVGAVAEMCYMAVYGSAAYLTQLQRLYDLFAANNSELESTFPGTPLCQRLEIYRHLGFVKDTIVLRERPDINRVQVNGQGIREEKAASGRSDVKKATRAGGK